MKPVFGIGCAGQASCSQLAASVGVPGFCNAYRLRCGHTTFSCFLVHGQKRIGTDCRRHGYRHIDLVSVLGAQGGCLVCHTVFPLVTLVVKK